MDFIEWIDANPVLWWKIMATVVFLVGLLVVVEGIRRHARWSYAKGIAAGYDGVHALIEKLMGNNQGVLDDIVAHCKRVADSGNVTPQALLKLHFLCSKVANDVKNQTAKAMAEKSGGVDEDEEAEKIMELAMQRTKERSPEALDPEILAEEIEKAVKEVTGSTTKSVTVRLHKKVEEDDGMTEV